MTGAALTLGVLLLLIAAALRAAGASLVRTPRADALHDAAVGEARRGPASMRHNVMTAGHK